MRKPRTGDRVSLSISPSLKLGDGVYLKPHVSISRELGDDPVNEMAVLRRELVREYFKAAITELTAVDALVSALADCRDAGEMADVLKRECQHVVKSVIEKIESEE